MMEETVEDGAGDHLVAEHLAPGPEALIAGNDDRAPLITARHQLKEQVRSLPAIGRYPISSIIKSCGWLSSLSRSSNLPSASALPSVVMSAVAVTNKVRTPCSQAFIPSATAKWLFPTPGGPRNRTLSPLCI